MSKVHRIEILFPCPVELPPGFERTLDALTGMVCELYEQQNPDRTMWPMGHGAKPLWREPEEPDWDNTVFQIDVAEREAFPKELERRAWEKMTPEQRKAHAEKRAQGKP